MAATISFDAIGGPAQASATTVTWSHTVGAGTNGILMVYASKVAGSISGVTYNSVALTAGPSVDGNPSYALFYLVNPASGAHNVVVTTGNANECIAGSASYFGVDQTNPLNASKVSSLASPAAVTFTTTKDGCWLVTGGYRPGTNVFAAGAGTTLRGQTNSTDSFGIFDSNGTVSAGSNSLNITWAGGSNIDIMGAALQPAVGSRYWVGGTANWDAATTTHWSLTTGGVSGAAVPVASTSTVVGDNVFFDGSSGGGTTTITASAGCENLDFTGYAGTLAGSSALSISGGLTLVSGMIITYTGALSFTSLSTTGTRTITSGTKTLLSDVTFNGSGGIWSLADALTCKTITFTAGELLLNAVTVTLTGSGTVWSAVSAALLVGGTSTIKLTDATSSSKTFSGGGKTYGNIWITGSGTGAYTIAGSNSFIDFKADTPPHTINFTAGTTQYVQTFTVNGTAGNLMTLQSTSGGTSWFLQKTTSGTVSCDYLSLQDSHAS